MLGKIEKNHRLDTVGVAGSIPVEPTISNYSIFSNNPSKFNTYKSLLIITSSYLQLLETTQSYPGLQKSGLITGESKAEFPLFKSKKQKRP